MRTPIIAGNWKMNNTIAEAKLLVNNIKKHSLNENVEAVICVPFVVIESIKKEIENTNIKLGAQNMHWEENGAFTGEISPKMLKELGVEYVIVGHSERRQYFNETDETVNKKVKSALSHGIKPIVCVGETLEERESNIEQQIVEKQILAALNDITEEQLNDIVVAYEPIWAIGTGKTATSEQANDIIAYIRKVISTKYSNSHVVRIQYGGSVKPGNISELMNMEDIDGALVGGASLVAEDFVKLINF